MVTLVGMQRAGHESESKRKSGPTLDDFNLSWCSLVSREEKNPHHRVSKSFLWVLVGPFGVHVGFTLGHAMAALGVSGPFGGWYGFHGSL
jgi:hypothetical protein